MTFFNADERKRISGAISKAERKTSGEIVAVVAAASDSYTYVPFMYAALAALFVPWPLIHFTWMPVQWIYLIQLLVFGALVLLLWPRAIRFRLVPRSVRNAHVERRAREQFLVQNLHTTSGRTGILIFVSVAERHAVILADKNIHNRVEAGTWQGIVDQLTSDIGDGRATDGFVSAIETAGGHLARHFPPGSVDHNELPDHLIVLDG